MDNRGIIVDQQIIEILSFFKKQQARFSKKTWKRIILLSLVVIAAFAWWWHKQPLSWTEEVKLTDGRIITIKQRLHGAEKHYDFGGGTGGWSVESWEIAALPELGIKTPWQSKYSKPIMFNQTSEGEWYVVMVGNCSSMTEYVWDTSPDIPTDDWGRGGLTQEVMKRMPPHPYFEYRYRNDQWVKVDMPKERFGELTNLLFMLSWVKDPGHHYSWEEKQARLKKLLKNPMYVRSFIEYLKIAEHSDWNHHCKQNQGE